MVESAAMWIQHMQKALNEMNLHLHHVLSDISGLSALRARDKRQAMELRIVANHIITERQLYKSRKKEFTLFCLDLSPIFFRAAS